MTLRERILMADPTLYVRDIVSPVVLARLPERVRRPFEALRIEWMPNRTWGQSFNLDTAHVVKLGHRQGDHVATYPSMYGLSLEEGENYLRAQIEGSLLHELGHALLDRLEPQEVGPLKQQAAQAALKDGVVSTYMGHCIGGRQLQPMTAADEIHEMWAEAFRYALMGNADYTRMYPRWCALTTTVLQASA